MPRVDSLTKVRAGVLVAVLAALSACSPYVYKDEIAAFGGGVDKSVAAFGALHPALVAYETAERDKELLAFASDNIMPAISDGCEVLRTAYVSRLAKALENPTGDLLTATDFAACIVEPVPDADPQIGLPNLTALGETLKAYAAALVAITDAGDEEELRSAFTNFNTSAVSLVGAVNKELEKKQKEKVSAMANLVEETGLIFLRQRRFNALKKAVNSSNEVVSTAAILLADAAFAIYGPTLTAKKDALDEAADAATNVPSDTYISVWTSLQTARTAYLQAFKDSPVSAFAKIQTTHEALRKSINNPKNQAQLNATLANAKALKKTAEAALAAIRKNDEAVGGG